MPETPATRVLTEANAVELFKDLFNDITGAPFNVVFDALIWTPEIIEQNTIGLRLAGQTPGFHQAPAGFCRYKGEVEIHTKTFLEGRGREATQFHHAAGLGWDARGFVFPPGTHDAGLRHLTVDGRYFERDTTIGTAPGTQPAGGIYGTNVSVVNSRHIYLEHVRSINAVQHCFDFTTPYYGNAGDGAIIPDPSEFIYATDCYADKYGDDGFTSHGSGHIWYTRCHANGTRYALERSYVNSNGFEADDYSYDVNHTDCYSTGNAHGFEAKAHGTMSAARDVTYIGCHAERNECNWSQRHIGHHVNYPGNPAVRSLTAENIQMIGCKSTHPRRVFFGGVENPDQDVPDDQTPPGSQYHHWVVGAYHGVTNTNFTMRSDPNYNYAGSSAVLIHFLAGEVVLDGYRIQGHTTGTWDIHCTGGDQPAENVTILGGTHKDSAPGGISCGGSSNASIQHIRLSRNVPGSPNKTACRAFGNKTIRDVKIDPATPYQYNFDISQTFYSQYESPLVTNVAYNPQPVFA
ncbi:hypothetical protein ASF21_12955 [Arthrobacter sp. Leaf234]|uniref:hypothetical protein n=1 Tax=Arthrobacter sp. Leaf234 TaxID=1736303 RepID=UPI0007011465|nr:hypothetical protein [Arthrobacter sp. Leaf234]KQN99711.1 hypothetical protein ASF21_12955 [Arthrobacter sp. Leaf234]